MIGLGDIPEKRHWAILTARLITIPGDQRSRDAPGHGYPESRETVINYEVFTDYEKWNLAVKNRTYRGEKFRAIIVDVPTIEVVVRIGRGLP